MCRSMWVESATNCTMVDLSHTAVTMLPYLVQLKSSPPLCWLAGDWLQSAAAPLSASAGVTPQT